MNLSKNIIQINNLVQILNSKNNKSTRANCFNAIELFWQDTSIQKFLGPEEFVIYVRNKFNQTPLENQISQGDVTIVWLRSSFELPVGKINIEDLFLKHQGYPFGLIIEHAFIEIDGKIIFQKPDPNTYQPYQIISRSEALYPYVNSKGYELTRHHRRQSP